MILEGHKLRIGNAEYPVSKMLPDDSQEFTLPINSTTKKIELVSPTCFVVLESDIPLNQ